MKTRNIRTRQRENIHTTRNKNGKLYSSLYYPIHFDYHQDEKFVFFDSLLRKPAGSLGYYVGKQIERFLYTSVHNPTITRYNSENQNIEQALDFLQAAATLEKQREENFLDYYIKNNPAMQAQIAKIRSSGGDQYLALVSQFNIAIKGYDAFSKQIDKEIERIQKRREILKLDREAYEKGRSVDRREKNKQKTDLLTSEEFSKRRALDGDGLLGDTTLNPYYNLDGTRLFKGMMSERSTFGKIISKIVSQYAAKIFQVINGDLNLNKKNFPALLLLITQRAYVMLATEFEGGVSKQEGESANELAARIGKNLDTLLADNGKMDKIVDEMLADQGLEYLLTSVAEQYNIEIDPKILKDQKIETKTFSRNLKKSYEKEKAAGRVQVSFEKWRKQYNATVNDVKDILKMIGSIKVQGYYTSENIALSQLLTENISGVLNGNKNPTDDFEAGTLVFDVEYEDTDKKNRTDVLDKARRRLAESQAAMSRELDKITDVESYIENEDRIEEMLQKQLKIIEELKQDTVQNEETMKEIIKHINIHGTVKGYASIGATTTEFEGAAFGENISEQVAIIEEMVSAGGISIADKDWLLFALMNCGKGMIGSGNKNSLEDYLSAFVGLLMFNGSRSFIKDVVEYMQDTYSEANRSITDLHLYVLNNTYVPNSYILSETYRYLAKVYGQIESESKNPSQGIQLTLSTYNPTKTEGFSVEELRFPEAIRWRAEADEALRQTKLKITFMAGFLDLLDSLQRQAADFSFVGN